MILTLGLLSIAQVCFILGAIIYRLLIGRSSTQQSLPISFALSIVFNWVVVFYSAKFGFFNLHTLCLILVEAFARTIFGRATLNQANFHKKLRATVRDA